uniref:BAH domain-containing protein n=1 Tax=Hippocampus comes TaxID=109280 RepID=A0A3Q2YDZ4_HIPCM
AEPSTWLGAPCCQRGSYAFYKSVGSKTRADGPVQVWRLGEFYFVRCGAEDPVCIAEVTLLWEDQMQRHLLASTRLYFLPEDTPKGRTGEHGEDEVLAVSRKMVMRVEDLVRWSCAEPPGWIGKPKAAPYGVAECKSVKVLSYPQYCRYRSLQRRIQDDARGPALQDVHLLALGGVRVTPSTRLMYCRDTFNHPTLESSVSFSWHFRCPSLSLRGRPRKRRGHDGRDTPTSGQSESWIEKMKSSCSWTSSSPLWSAKAHPSTKCPTSDSRRVSFGLTRPLFYSPEDISNRMLISLCPGAVSRPLPHVLGGQTSRRL